MSGPIERRRAWRIVRKVEAELHRQHEASLLRECGKMDDMGHIQVGGTVDLAVLVYVVEQALISEFRK